MGGGPSYHSLSISITATGYLRQGELFLIIVEETGYGSWQNSKTGINNGATISVGSSLKEHG